MVWLKPPDCYYVCPSWFTDVGDVVYHWKRARCLKNKGNFEKISGKDFQLHDIISWEQNLRKMVGNLFHEPQMLFNKRNLLKTICCVRKKTGNSVCCLIILSILVSVIYWHSWSCAESRWYKSVCNSNVISFGTSVNLGSDPEF